MNKKKLIVLGLLIVGYLTFLSPHRAWPTVSNTAVATTTGYGNGSNTSFPITFDFRSNSWLTVALHDTSTNPATVTQIPQQGGASGFSVTGGNPGTQIVMGTAPTLTQFLVISRAVPLTQGVAFNPASIFPYNGLSSQLDQITLALQNINVFGGPSTVSGSGGSGGGGGGSGSLPNPGAPFDFIGWNSTGASTVNATIAYDSGHTTFQNGDMLQFNGSGWATQQFNQSGLMQLLNGAPNSPLSAASGGTGVLNSANLQWGNNAITLNTSGTTNVTLPTSGTLLSGTATNNDVANSIVQRDVGGNFSAGTVTSNLIGNVTGNVTGNTSGTASNVTGVVAFGNGGTGQTTQQTAIQGLLNTAAAPASSTLIGSFPRYDGTNVTMDTIKIGDVPQGFSRLKLAQGPASTLLMDDAAGNITYLAGVTSGNCAGFNGITWVSVPCGVSGSLVGVTYYGTDTGTANHYVVTTPTSPGSYSPGVIVAFEAAHTNTGVSDLNLDGLGVANLQKYVNGVATNLAAGDITATSLMNAVYDGTQFIVTVGLPQVTTVAMTTPVGLSVAGSPISSSGTFALSWSGAAIPNSAWNPMTTGGDMIYETAGLVAARLANGTAGQILTSAGTTLAPTWGNLAPQATNIAGGVIGDIPYQSAANTTLFVAAGNANQMLQGNGAAIPIWVNPTTNPPGAASSWAGWDSNKNFTTNNLLNGYTTTVTSASTDTLTVASTYNQIFTGNTAAQIVAMPAVNSIALGTMYTIVNLSNQVVTVNSSGGNTIQAMAANTQLNLTSIAAVGTTAAVWNWVYQSVQAALPGANATNLNGGLGGSIPYQTAVNTTAMLANGNAGQVLQSGGTTAAPVWSASVLSATDLIGGVLGNVPYQVAAGTTAFVHNGTSGQVLTSNGNGAPSWQTSGGGGATGNYAQAYTTNAAYWSTSSATYADPTVSGTPALTVRRSSGLALTQAGSNYPGVTLTPSSSTAVYLVTATFDVGIVSATGAYVDSRLYDGTTEIGRGMTGGWGTNGSGFAAPVTISAIYAPATTSAVTLRIQLAAPNGAPAYLGAIGFLASSLSNSVEWTVVQIVS